MQRAGAMFLALAAALLAVQSVDASYIDPGKYTRSFSDLATCDERRVLTINNKYSDPRLK